MLLGLPRHQYSFDVAQLLIERDADINARDKEHQTQLHMASKLELARILDHSANVNAADNRDRTPLHRPGLLQIRQIWFRTFRWCTGKDGKAFRLFSGARCGRECTEEDYGETRLHIASRLMSLEVVWILLKHGAGTNVENNEGKIPFQLVQESTRE
ncbi:ankyrin repeat-containing domain protein [Lactarius akahatsu]|uniref:Ankyrin repeat-containing domain protein n=1 Tax=Lactarius akahatsu TaxID=416441 RepID=A0AAD4Q8T7_9AGAM|nr:ankyrin repeat-containing domain protein [Lactarius akahatsu]